jgi:hypothetical protein
MGNSPSVSTPAPSAAPSVAAPAVNATAANAVPNSKKNDNKTVIQVPAENVTVSKGGKRRRLRGGVASVQFDLIPRLQPSDAVMEQVTSVPSSQSALSGGLLKGGKRKRAHKRKTHKRKVQKRRAHKRHTYRK